MTKYCLTDIQQLKKLRSLVAACLLEAEVQHVRATENVKPSTWLLRDKLTSTSARLTELIDTATAEITAGSQEEK